MVGFCVESESGIAIRSCTLNNDIISNIALYVNNEFYMFKNLLFMIK